MENAKMTTNVVEPEKLKSQASPDRIKSNGVNRLQVNEYDTKNIQSSNYGTMVQAESNVDSFDPNGSGSNITSKVGSEKEIDKKPVVIRKMSDPNKTKFASKANTYSNLSSKMPESSESFDPNDEMTSVEASKYGTTRTEGGEEPKFELPKKFSIEEIPEQNEESRLDQTRNSMIETSMILTATEISPIDAAQMKKQILYEIPDQKQEYLFGIAYPSTSTKPFNVVETKAIRPKAMLHANKMEGDSPEMIEFNYEVPETIKNQEGRNLPAKCEIHSTLVQTPFQNDMSFTAVDPKGGKSHQSENVDQDILDALGNKSSNNNVDIKEMDQNQMFEDKSNMAEITNTTDGNKPFDDKDISNIQRNPSYVYSEGKNLCLGTEEFSPDKPIDSKRDVPISEQSSPEIIERVLIESKKDIYVSQHKIASEIRQPTNTEIESPDQFRTLATKESPSQAKSESPYETDFDPNASIEEFDPNEQNSNNSSDKLNQQNADLQGSQVFVKISKKEIVNDAIPKIKVESMADDNLDINYNTEAQDKVDNLNDENRDKMDNLDAENLNETYKSKYSQQKSEINKTQQTVTSGQKFYSDVSDIDLFQSSGGESSKDTREKEAQKQVIQMNNRQNFKGDV